MSKKGELIWLDIADLMRAHKEQSVHLARAQDVIFYGRIMYKYYLLYSISIKSVVDLGLRTRYLAIFDLFSENHIGSYPKPFNQNFALP